MKYSILVQTPHEQVVYIIDTVDESVHVYDSKGVEVVVCDHGRVTLNSITTSITRVGWKILNVDAMDDDSHILIPRTIPITFLRN